jgi:hypothetical protein
MITRDRIWLWTIAAMLELSAVIVVGCALAVLYTVLDDPFDPGSWMGQALMYKVLVASSALLAIDLFVLVRYRFSQPIGALIAIAMLSVLDKWLGRRGLTPQVEWWPPDELPVPKRKGPAPSKRKKKRRRKKRK